MKTLAFNINIHKYFLLKKYRFFDIGNDNFYFDEQSTCSALEASERNCLKPALEMLLALAHRYKRRFKFSITISGFALQLIEQYCPNTLELLKQLAHTNAVEFVASPYNHSLAGVNDIAEFKKQVGISVSEIQRLFNVTPATMQNTDLIYTDSIGVAAYEMGFKTVLLQPEERSLEVKGTDYLYFHPTVPRLKIITQNRKYSILFENALKDGKLFAPDYLVEQLGNNASGGDILFASLNCEYLDGTKYNNRDVLLYVKSFVENILDSKRFKFDTPSSALQKFQPIAPYKLPDPVPGLNYPAYLAPWLGNDLQREAFAKLNALKEKIKLGVNATLQQIWQRLQCSDYFFFMSDGYLDGTQQNIVTNPFGTPYNAFITYMNIIGDFERRVHLSIDNTSINQLSNKQIADSIKYYQARIKELKQEYQKRNLLS